MDGFKILYRRGPAEIEDVLVHSDVACASALACCDVSEAMFDSDALAQPSAACGSGLQHSELLLQALIFCDADSPPLAVGGVCALSAKQA